MGYDAVGEEDVPLMTPFDGWMVAAVAVSLGALVQGTIGLGLGLVAAPVVALIDPSLLPGTLVWLGLLLPVVTLIRERTDIDWWGLRWAFVGRIPAALLGAWIVSIASPHVLAMMVGVVILVAVVLTIRTVRLPMVPPVLVAAGFVSGVSGTATSIGGPPLALVYQRELAPRVRATLATYFVVGASLSLVALTLTDQLTARQTVAALWLAPALILGFGLSILIRNRIDGARLRAAVLVVCAGSALVLIGRNLPG
jgi:hypothetical protein